MRLWYYSAIMQSNAKTVEQYVSALPEDRREAIQAIRKTILKNLPKGYEEGMQYGMIGYYVPHSIYPDGYHCDPKQPLPFASVASQKNHMALYLMCTYIDQEQDGWFRKAWEATGKKLDMGKSCVRFKRIEDVPLSVVGQAVKRVPVKKFIEFYESAVNMTGKRSAKTSATKSGAGSKKSGAGATKSKGAATAKKSPKSKKEPTSAAMKTSTSASAVKKSPKAKRKKTAAR